MYKRQLYSRADVFGVDLYAVGLGEKIEGMVKELYAGNGAVRKTCLLYTSGGKVSGGRVKNHYPKALRLP